MPSAAFASEPLPHATAFSVRCTLPQLLFLSVSFFLFPTWFISKTPTGGFFYYAVLAFFFNKGLRLNNKK